MSGNVAELVQGCGRVIDRLIYLVRDGSPENVNGCEYTARLGGAYYHAGTRAEYTSYDTVDFSNPGAPDTASYVGFRLVRELSDTADAQ